MAGSLIILTGASGGGKTTLAHATAAAYPDLNVYFFDSVGVPGPEEMAAFGGENWQRTTTLDWMKRLAPELAAGRPVLFEGQIRIAFIRDGLAAAGIAHALIFLVDCDDAVRLHRLTHNRRQPELADTQMMDWARYLREEAARESCDIVDTGKFTVAESVALLGAYLG